MSVQALSWAFAQELPSSSVKLVLIALANRADEEGVCYPSIGWIAQMSSQSERTCQRAIAELIELGFIVKTTQYRDNGSQSSNVYQLLIGGGDKLTGGGCQSVRGGVTQVTPLINETLNKNKKNTLSRDEFLREIDKGITDGAFKDVQDRCKLTDDLLRMAASDAWDYWQGFDKWPVDLIAAFRGWCRQWKAETEIHSKRLESVSSKKNMGHADKELNTWAVRVSTWQKTGFWSADLFGPAPDQHGTRVPASIVEQLQQQPTA